MAGTTKRIGGATTYDERLRIEWGEALADSMRLHGISRKELQKRLVDDFGIEVSVQVIGYWLAGQNAPRPEVQSAIGTVLHTQARLIFAIPNLPKRAA